MCEEETPTPSRPSTTPNSSQPTNGTTVSCNCTVTLSPADVKLCGVGNTRDVIATGTPSGGTYSFSSSDTAVATVSGSGDTGTITAVAQGTAVITVTYNVSGCMPCTDTVTANVCVCTPASPATRHYAFAQKRATNLTGGKATIKTRYGKLCCEHMGCTDLAKNNAYVNISNGGKWAQTGYRRIRNAGSTTYTKMRYTEMNGSVYKRKDDTPGAPAEGSSHDYRVELDSSTGTWTFYYDSTAWSTFTDNGWKDIGGVVVQWPGEIINKEDDMPGSSGAKCNFTDCKYRTGTSASYVDAGLTAGDLHTDDATEWGIELVSVTAFNIWDKKPNP